MELPFNHDQRSENKPVTVLGRTFANDDERHTFFRNELRKHLPELKKIEGFPIGEDDDIINLSDPPFYTACPNPWINDFIAEWEAEKVELQAQGKRVADFEVDEPYASDVSEGKNNPIYNAHSYHTKVPHPAIMRYILHYTQPGDIVFDGFAGTGMTGVAAGMCGNPDKEIKATIENEFKSAGLTIPNWGARHAICGDLSPIASFISYNLNKPSDINAVENKFNEILNEVEKRYSWMYKTEVDKKLCQINYTVWSEMFICPNCLSPINYFESAVNLEKKEVNEILTCEKCQKSLSKKDLLPSKKTQFDPIVNNQITQSTYSPVVINYIVGNKKNNKIIDESDFDLFIKIESEFNNISKYIKSIPIPKGIKTNEFFRKGFTHSHHCYTKRNFIALWSFYKLIPNDDYCIKLIFLSICQTLSSNLVRYNMGNRGNGPLSGTIFVPSLIAESNVFKLLRGKFSDFKKVFPLIINQNVQTIQSATSLTNINDNSMDYIFIDPPFGANIMYSDLNFLWESWLKVYTNTQKEAIENKLQNKSLFDYNGLMYNSFAEYYKKLKYGKWITIEFSNTNASVWNGIQTSLQKAGFIIGNVAAIDKQQGSFNAVSNSTSVKQDLIISCYKPSAEFDTKFQQSQHSEVGIWDFVAEHLSHLPVHLLKDNATTAVIERSPKILFDRLIAFYVQRNLPVPIDAGLFQKGLKERFIERDGMYFTAEQVHEYDSKKSALPNFVQLSLLVASEQDGVMWLRRELEHTAQTYQELQPKWMQALAGVRKGDILPELKDILEENFLQNESGAWYLPDLENEIDLEKVRTGRMLRLFATYREQASKPKGKIKEARVEALRVGFKQCYKDKDFKTIVTIGDSIPNNLLMEDEVLLQYYDIAISRV